MGNDIFNQYAWNYFKLGMNVMPVHDRMPLERGFNDLWYDKRQTEEQLEYLIDAHPNANGIAMITGAYGTVVDVDIDDAELSKLIPRTPMKRFGSKGMGYLYKGALLDKKQPPSVPIELFGKGYVVLPPSYHPKTNSYYSWRDTNFTEITELPEFTLNDWRILEEHCHKHGLMRVGAKGSDGFVDATGGRNIVLSSRVRRLVKDPSTNQLPIDQLVDLIMEYDQQLHPTNPWFEDINERRHKTPRQFATNFVALALRKAQREAGTVIVDAASWVEPEQHVPVVITKSQNPLDLIPKGGIMEAVHDYVSATNGYENGALSLSGALSLCSILAGHRIVVGTNCHPNIFVICTAESGAGKSAPQKAVKHALLESANGSSLIGYDSYASTQSVALGLSANRRRLDIIDECKNLFTSNASNQSHLRGVDAELCKIFSCSDGYLPGKQAVNKDSQRPPLNNPYLSSMMFSTPAAFHRYFSNMLAEEGFGGRTLFISDTTDLSQVDRGLIGFNSNGLTRASYPTQILDKINYWLTMDISYVDGRGRKCAFNEAGGSPRCYHITMSKDAQELALSYQQEYSGLWSGSQNPGDPDYELHACFNRAMEQHYKLLGCWVVSQADETHVVGVRELEWAHAVYEYSLNGLRELIAKGLMQTEYQTNLNRYCAWAKGKKDIDKKHFMQWIRRTLKAEDMRVVANFVTMLENEGYGHLEHTGQKSPNGKIKAKWVFEQQAAKIHLG